jgi:hypothetical protein
LQENPDGWTFKTLRAFTGIPRITLLDNLKALVKEGYVLREGGQFALFSLTETGFKTAREVLSRELSQEAGGHVRVHGLIFSVDILAQPKNIWLGVGDWRLIKGFRYPRFEHITPAGIKIHRTPNQLLFYFQELPLSNDILVSESRAVSIVEAVCNEWIQRNPGLFLRIRNVKPVLGHSAFLDHPLAVWLKEKGYSAKAWSDGKGEERLRFDSSTGPGELEAVHPKKHVADFRAIEEVTRQVGGEGVKDLGLEFPYAVMDTADGLVDWKALKDVPANLDKLGRWVEGIQKIQIMTLKTVEAQNFLLNTISNKLATEMPNKYQDKREAG